MGRPCPSRPYAVRTVRGRSEDGRQADPVSVIRRLRRRAGRCLPRRGSALLGAAGGVHAAGSARTDGRFLRPARPFALGPVGGSGGGSRANGTVRWVGVQNGPDGASGDDGRIGRGLAVLGRPGRKGRCVGARDLAKVVTARRCRTARLLEVGLWWSLDRGWAGGMGGSEAGWRLGRGPEERAGRSWVVF
jgi:hypothetical protein